MSQGKRIQEPFAYELPFKSFNNPPKFTNEADNKFF